MSGLQWVILVIFCGFIGWLANAVDSVIGAVILAVVGGAVLGIVLRNVRPRTAARGDPEGPEDGA